MLRVTVNGVPRQFRDGQTILHALQSIGIEVPTLCHDARLKPFAGCRLCVVEVQGHARPLPACDSLLADGMVIETHTPQLEEDRRTLLKLMASFYPSEALRRFPEKEFHKQILKYGLVKDCRDLIPEKIPDDSNPYIQVDM